MSPIHATQYWRNFLGSFDYSFFPVSFYSELNNDRIPRSLFLNDFYELLILIRASITLQYSMYGFSAAVLMFL